MRSSFVPWVTNKRVCEAVSSVTSAVIKSVFTSQSTQRNLETNNFVLLACQKHAHLTDVSIFLVHRHPENTTKHGSSSFFIFVTGRLAEQIS